METNPPVVYIVDDDEAVRTSLAWLLSSVNIRTECFDGPEAFLKAYDANSLSCLILDVRMPEISGFQLQDRLKDIGADIPVIFVSGHGDIPMSVRALHNGAVDFLEKPYPDDAQERGRQHAGPRAPPAAQGTPEDPHRT